MSTKQRPVLKLKTSTATAKTVAKPAAKAGYKDAYAKGAPAKSGPAKPYGGAGSTGGKPGGERGVAPKTASQPRPASAPYGDRPQPRPASAPYGDRPQPRPASAPYADRPARPAAAESAAEPAASPWADAAPRQRKTGPNAVKPPIQRGPAPRPRLGEADFRPSHHRDFKPVVQTGFQTDLKGDSLANSLLGAATAVSQVRTGMALPQALAGVFANTNATPQARGAIQDIAYRAMRKLGWSDALIAIMAPKAPEPLVSALLACALPLMVQDADGTEAYSQFTVVDQTVNAAAAHPDTARAKAMVNAVLRRFQRERKELLDEVEQQAPAKWNYPQWWIDAAITAYPQDWQQILQIGNQPPPLTLRVNARRSTVAAYLETLEAAGIAARQVGPYAVRLEKPMGVHLIPGFDDGVVSVQDAGAQLAASLLDVRDGMRVLDACAAPGGKTCHILELADVNLTALDADPKRLVRVQENLDRLGLQATLQPAEAQMAAWWDGQQFDRIVADVPCTASGIVRRHPDIRWLRRKSDALQLATLSREILDNLWRMLAPNGKLLFVTCSLWPQESEAQAAAFAVRHGATRLDAPGQLLPTGSAEHDHDGLFYAFFQKDA